MKSTYNFLLTGADKENSTDGVIVRGITHMLEYFFSGCKIDYITLDDYKPMGSNVLLPENRYDKLIVCGTPWLWHNFQNSEKYRNLTRLFDTHTKSKKLFLGAGSCLLISSIGSNILKSPEEVAGIRRLYLQSTNIVRDKIAHDIMSNAKVNSTLLPCPSYYCYGIGEVKEGPRKKNVLVYIDPLKSIAKLEWQCPKRVKEFDELNMAFYKEYKPEVYVANKTDIEGAIRAGLPSPTVLNTYKETLTVMEEADYVLSCRIHCAVPGFVQGKAIGVIPIDSRSKTLEDFGCLMIRNIGDICKMKHEKRDFLGSLETYRKLIVGTEIKM